MHQASSLHLAVLACCYFSDWETVVALILINSDLRLAAIE